MNSINYTNVEHIKQTYAPPTIEVWCLEHQASVLNFLSTGGEVEDLIKGEVSITSDEWDEFS